jgi:hypothetical protein
MQVELLQGWVLQVRLLCGRLPQGWMLRGPLLRGPLLRGPLLGGPLLRGPLLLVLRLLNGEQPFWSPSTPLVSSSPSLFFSHWVVFFLCAYVKWQQLKRELLLLLWLVCYCSRS